MCPKSFLQQLPSHFYLDHRIISVRNSFVLLIHSLGAAVAPLQGHALWCDSARHSGSFMVISLLIPVIQHQLLADVSLITVAYVFLATLSSVPEA